MFGLRALVFLSASVLIGLAGLWTEWLWDRREADSHLVSHVTARLSREVLARQRGLDTLHTSDQFFSAQVRGLFLLRQDSLAAWSAHDFLPDFTRISDSLPVQFVVSPRSNFIAIVRTRGEREKSISVINLQDKYPISNRYLSTSLNADFFPFREGVLTDRNTVLGLPITVQGQTLFRVAPLGGRSHPPASLWLFVFASLFWVAAVARVASNLEQQSAVRAWLVFASGLVALRATQIGLDFPRLWVQHPVFDPRVYAASYFNFSPGDLLINAVAILAIIAYGYARCLPALLQFSFSVRFALPRQVLLHLVAFAAILYPYLFFESIYHNSALSIDITDSIEVTGVRLVLWLAVLVGLFTGWLLFLGAARLIRKDGDRPGITAAGFLLALLIFAGYTAWEKRDYLIPFIAIFLMVGGAQLWGRHLSHGNRWAQVAAAGFCALAAAGVFYLGEERKSGYQQRFALNDLAVRDELGEYLLFEASRKIQDDPFILSVWNNPMRNRDRIKEKIRRVFLQTYFDQYDVTIQLFEGSGESLEQVQNPDLADFLWQHRMQSVPTGYEGVYVVREPRAVSLRTYRVITPVKRSGRTTGFIVVNLTLKQAIPKSVFPELLMDEKRIQLAQIRALSYAWGRGDTILNQYGPFDYRQLNLAALPAGRNSAQRHFTHFVIRDSPGSWLAVSRPLYTVQQAVSNFCFFVLLFLAAAAAAYALQPGWWRPVANWTYARRIQIATLLSALVPFAIIAVLLFQGIRSFNREQINAQFLARAQRLAEALAMAGGTQAVSQNDLFDQFRRIAELDFSLFNNSGALLATNQPAVYDQRLISPVLPPDVVKMAGQGTAFLRKERLGGLTYTACYVPVRDRRQPAQAILAVPFFDYDRLTEQAEIQILNWLLILFVAIGLLAVWLANRLAARIIKPLQWIAGTMDQTTFRQSPTPVAWPRQDELGVLVNAYNRMLQNWNEARDILAKKEKESAWREMARQVAHEIKNPLTPMKLTLQQMERLQAENALSDERVRAAVASLLHQVEALNEIATSFSSFAGLPQPRLAVLPVNEVVGSVVSLFQNHPQGQVIWRPGEPLLVKADEKILSRALFNIVLNALQSSDNPVAVRIRVWPDGEKVCIAVTDDGPGIPDDVKATLFTPYFSTKKSGSGLGLAISRQGIELCGGSISFESEAGRGTTFFVVLPRGSSEGMLG
jgi:signal transduction histidine kinase